jgi:hypothetical protein
MAFISVPFPHMVLNSHDVPPPDYGMLNSWKVGKSETVDHMVDWIKTVALGMPDGGKIRTLIFNAHGSPGAIHVGQGIGLGDLHKFQLLKTKDGLPLIKEIWIVACKVAGKGKFVSGGPDGETFCKDLALATGALVTAGTREQRTGTDKIPLWHIDEWEGEVRTYDPKGNRTIRQHDNASYEE